MRWERQFDMIKNFQDYEIALVKENENLYPKGLLNISGRPVLLYYKGNIEIINQYKNIAVVGTRKASEKGQRAAYEAGQLVAEKGINLVNGLALGCDAAAIKGALNSGGKCIAIMPCGLEQVQPKSHYELAEEILAKGGCILSEYPVGTSVQKYQYVARDRLQSGISQGVIVIEAEEKSGTMHTADYALKQYKRIACYYNELIEHSSGNRLLETNEKVQVLKTKEDERKFIDYIINDDIYVQMTLF